MRLFIFDLDKMVNSSKNPDLILVDKGLNKAKLGYVEKHDWELARNLPKRPKVCHFYFNNGYSSKECVSVRKENRKKKSSPPNNQKRPKKIWVPKVKNVPVASLPLNNVEKSQVVLKRRMLKGHDWRLKFVQKFTFEEKRTNDNVRSQIIGIGNMGKNDSYLIIDILLVEELKHNLLSNSEFNDKGYKISFEPFFDRLKWLIRLSGRGEPQITNKTRTVSK